MSEKISWTLNVQVEGGPNVSASQSITVDAYDKIQVTVGTQDTKAVEVQPGDADRVRFLLISSDQFGDDLTYKVDAGGSDIKMDAQQLLIGDGAVGLLDAAPKTLTFTNNLAQDANIEILVGRMVTA